MLHMPHAPLLSTLRKESVTLTTLWPGGLTPVPKICQASQTPMTTHISQSWSLVLRTIRTIRTIRTSKLHLNRIMRVQVKVKVKLQVLDAFHHVHPSLHPSPQPTPDPIHNLSPSLSLRYSSSGDGLFLPTSDELARIFHT